MTWKMASPFDECPRIQYLVGVNMKTRRTMGVAFESVLVVANAERIVVLLG